MTKRDNSRRLTATTNERGRPDPNPLAKYFTNFRFKAGTVKVPRVVGREKVVRRRVPEE